MIRLMAMVWATKVLSTPALAKFSLQPSTVQKQDLIPRSSTQPSYGFEGEQSRPAMFSSALKKIFVLSSYWSKQRNVFGLPAEPAILHATVVELQSVRVDLMRSLKVASSEPAALAAELTERVDCQHFNPEITNIDLKFLPNIWILNEMMCSWWCNEIEYLKGFQEKLQKSIGWEVFVLVAPCCLTCFLGLTVQAPEPFTKVA